MSCRRLPPGGANAARNAGIASAAADLIVLVDDDVQAPAGLARGAPCWSRAAPDPDVFGGPIRAVLEGGGPRSCGRERPPITTLDLGDDDRDAELVWSANMAMRRRALDSPGPFDESISGPAAGSTPGGTARWDSRGDEEDWERRYRARGGTIRYLAGAGLDHRRTRRRFATPRPRSGGVRPRPRARAASTGQGDTAPSLGGELRTLIGCVWHIFRRRCLNGVVLTAHSSGRA